MFQSAPILLGQYRPVDSFLHRLDARAKMLPITVVLILGLLTNSFLFYGIVLTALIVALLFSGVGVGQLTRNFKPVIALVIVTAAYHLLFSGDKSEVLFKLGPIVLREKAVLDAAFYSLRLVLFVSVAFLITLTSAPSELADAVSKLLAPLERIKVPVQDLSLILFMAMRFIPVLYEEFQAIRNAQVIRGVKFTGSIVNRVKKTVSIIIPVFVAALQRADELALAIEARGYKSGVKRTSYSRLEFGPREWAFAVWSTGLIIVLWWVTRAEA